MKRASKAKGGWLALEATAKPTENGQAAESSTASSAASSSAVPENAKHVQIKFGGMGWVPADVENGSVTGRIMIGCPKCKKSELYLTTDRTFALCYASGCDAEMPVRKA
jgi:hypothetical protein